MPRKPKTQPEPPAPRPPITYGWFRAAAGHDVARIIARAAGMAADSLRQRPMLDRVIPTERRLRIAVALEALAANLTNIARELRAEDEP